MTRFALQPRWLAWHLLLVVVLVSFGWLGRWQLSSFEHKGTHRSAAARGCRARPAQPARRAPRRRRRRPPGGGARAGTTGRRRCWCPRDRGPGPTAGPDGFLVVTPLRTRAGVLPVVRGWVPTARLPRGRRTGRPGPRRRRAAALGDRSAARRTGHGAGRSAALRRHGDPDRRPPGQPVPAVRRVPGPAHRAAGAGGPPGAAGARGGQPAAAAWRAGGTSPTRCSGGCSRPRPCSSGGPCSGGRRWSSGSVIRQSRCRSAVTRRSATNDMSGMVPAAITSSVLHDRPAGLSASRNAVDDVDDVQVAVRGPQPAGGSLTDVPGPEAEAEQAAGGQHHAGDVGHHPVAGHGAGRGC